MSVFTIVLFVFSTIFTVFMFYKASHHSKKVLLVIILWGSIHAVLALFSFYENTETIPPRFPLMVVPALIFITYLFNSKKGQSFIDSLDQTYLLLIHTVRIPVEIVLYLLFLEKLVPELMTFSGINFDILVGITAPIIYYFVHIKAVISKKIEFIWNIISLILLLNIVVNAIFSAPGPIQLQAFDQPNLAILMFPIIWLPVIIVPLVMLSQIASMRYYLRNHCSI